MLGQFDKFSSAVENRLSKKHVRYEAPCDLLPWADPYIASLFAGTDGDATPASRNVYHDEPEHDSYVVRGR